MFYCFMWILLNLCMAYFGFGYKTAVFWVVQAIMFVGVTLYG